MINQTAEYGLRAMAWIATHQSEGAVRAQDMSAAVEVPSHYLAKILRRLVVAKLLISRKGPGGGFLLARAAETIRFADILQALDALPSHERCAFGWGQCSAAHPCPLHPSWEELSGSFSEWAARRTLADALSVPLEERLLRE